MKKEKASKTKVSVKELEPSTQIEDEISSLIEKMKDLKIPEIDEQIEELSDSSSIEDKIDTLETIRNAMNGNSELKKEEHEATPEKLMNLAEKHPSLMEALKLKPRVIAKKFKDMRVRYALTQYDEQKLIMPLFIKSEFGIETEEYKELIETINTKVDAGFKEKKKKHIRYVLPIAALLSGVSFFTIPILWLGVSFSVFFAVAGVVSSFGISEMFEEKSRLGKRELKNHPSANDLLRKGLKDILEYNNTYLFYMDDRVFVKKRYDSYGATASEVKMFEDFSIDVAQIDDKTREKLTVVGWL